MSTWGYKKDNGPSLWSKWYPVADLGERQSPIDIKTADVVAADDMSELKYQYDPANIRIVNTGATWRMDFSADGSSRTGAPRQERAVSTQWMVLNTTLSFTSFTTMPSTPTLPWPWTSLTVSPSLACSSRPGPVTLRLRRSANIFPQSL